MTTEAFFQSLNSSSLVKSSIVVEYFLAWQGILHNYLKQCKKSESDIKLGYIDLYVGPGKDDAGQESTPLLIIKRVINSPFLRNSLISIFNDVDEKKIVMLKKAILELPGIDLLKYQPQFNVGEVGEHLAEKFERMSFVPSFYFVDPWGYRGLSQKLFKAILKDWGSDFMFFFNYRRINAALNYAGFQERMAFLFGDDRARELTKKLMNDPHANRRALILTELKDMLNEIGGSYIQPFTFKTERGRIRHDLICVSKHRRGYEAAKNVMSKYCRKTYCGVPQFDFKSQNYQEIALFSEHNVNQLAKDLCECFSGKSLAMKDIYARHHVGTKYIEINYKKALLLLESEGRVSIKRISNRRQSLETVGPSALVTFPNSGAE